MRLPRVVDFLIHAYAFSQQGQCQMVITGNPETERRLASPELSRRALVVYARILRSLLDSFDHAVLLVDEWDDVVLYNRRFEEMAQLEHGHRLEITAVRAAFAALGTTLHEAQLRELLASAGTSRLLELGAERAVLCRLAVLELDELGDYRLISLRQITRGARMRPDSEKRTGAPKSPPDVSVAPAAAAGVRLTLGDILEAVAEFGSASIALIAWEYMVDQRAVDPAMTEAIREGLLRSAEPGGGDMDAEAMYELTPRGAAQLEQLRDSEPKTDGDL
jgi:hypothetical protein